MGRRRLHPKNGLRTKNKRFGILSQQWGFSIPSKGVFRKGVFWQPPPPKNVASKYAINWRAVWHSKSLALLQSKGAFADFCGIRTRLFMPYELRLLWHMDRFHWGLGWSSIYWVLVTWIPEIRSRKLTRSSLKTGFRKGTFKNQNCPFLRQVCLLKVLRPRGENLSKRPLF